MTNRKKPLDWNKPVRTVGGLEVDVYSNTRFHGAIHYEDGHYGIAVWTPEGKWIGRIGSDSQYDLVNVPTKHKGRFYINVYIGEDGIPRYSSPHPSVGEAINAAGVRTTNCQARIGIDLEFEEGQYDL